MTRHSSLPATDDRNPVDVLADEFAARLRRGESPTMEEYVAKYPDHAAQIEELFPGVALLEQLSQQQESEASQTRRPKLNGLPPGHRLGEIEIIREIGRGGMGIVYEAYQHSLHRPVAVKAISGSALHSANQVARFQREAQAAAQLHHTNIVPVFGVGEQNDTSFYVMQLIHGVGLDSILAELTQKTRNGAIGGAEVGSSIDSHSARELANVLVSGHLSESTIRAAGGGSTWQPGRSSDATVPYLQEQLDAPAPLGEEAHHRERSLLPSRTVVTGQGDTSPPAIASSHVLRDESRPQLSVLSSLVLRDENRRGSEETFSQPPEGKKSRTNDELADTVAVDPSLSSLGTRYWRNIARIGVQVASGLQYAHSQGTLHRDIKPANILLDTEGTAWIADFGLAKLLQQEDVTKTGDVVGTLRYMAPEQFRGECDGRSDLYSLGLTLYELLTLRPADDDTDRQRLIAKKLTPHDPPHPRKLHPGIPRDLETIVLKCVAWEPDGRYQTASTLVGDLQAFLEDRPIAARRISQTERFWRWCRRNPVVATLAAAVALLLMTITGLMSVGYLRAQEKAAEMLALKDEAQAGREAAEKFAEEAQQARAVTEQLADIQWEALNRVYDSFVLDRFAGPVEATPDTEEETGLETQTASPATVLSPQTAAMLEQMLTSFDRIANIRGTDERYLEETARANLKVADLHLRLGQYNEAIESFERARDRYEDLQNLQGPNAETNLLLVRLHNGLGIAKSQLGELSAAHDALDTSLALLSSPLIDQQDPTVRLETAATHYLMARRPPRGMGPPPQDGDGLPGRGGRGRGGRESSGRRESAHGPAPPTASTVTDRTGPRSDAEPRDDGNGPRRGPDGNRGDHIGGDSREHLQQAIAILDPLMTEYPSMARYKFLSALCHIEMSHPSFRPDDHSGDEMLDKAIAILNEVVDSSPDEPDYLYQLSEAYEQRYHRWRATFRPLFLQKYPVGPEWMRHFGRQTDLTDIASAEQDLRAALAVSDRLVRQQPNVAAYAQSQQLLLFNLADVLAAQGSAGEARQLLIEAEQLQETLRERFPATNRGYDFYSDLFDMLEARVLLDLDEPDAARKLVESILERAQPSEPLDERQRRFEPMRREFLRPVYLMLAEAFEALGDTDAAAASRTEGTAGPSP